MTSKTYPLVNPAEVCAAIERAGGPAIDPTQPQGTIDTHGCKLLYTIANGSITIDVLRKPWIVSYGQIFGQLDKLFAGVS
jgi:hypothetical protein